MRKALATVCLVAVWLLVAHGQEQSPPAAPLRALTAELERASLLDRSLWNLAVQFQRERLYSANEVKEIVEKHVAASRAPEERAEASLVDQYREKLAALLGGWSMMGAARGQFTLLGGRPPLTFASKGEGLALLVRGVVSTVEHNTLRATARQRAAEVIRSVVLPSMKAFAALKDLPDVKFYALSVTYGSRDFLDRSALATKSETVAVVVPADVCARFIALEVSEDALLKAAEIYVADRDMITGIKRIEVALQ